MTQLLEMLFKHGADLFLHKTHSLIALLDEDGKTIESNGGLSYVKKQFPRAKSFVELLVSESHADFQQAVSDVIKNDAPVQTTLNFRGSDQLLPRSYNCWFVPVPDNRVLLYGDIIPTLDKKLDPDFIKLENELKVTQLQLAQKNDELAAVKREVKKAQGEIEKVSHIDDLTQLPNRLSILDYFEQQVKIARRYESGLSLFILNFDGFKQINDRYGFKAGDLLLKQCTEILIKAMRRSDFLGRYSGDEFIGILPQTNIDPARILATRIQEQIAETAFDLGEHKGVHVTVSIGVAEFEPELDSKDSLLWRKDSLLWRADHALLQAKENGRNQVYVWQETD